jgi:hypothetical protein
MELGVSIEVLNGTGSVSTEKVEYGSAVSVQIAPKNGDYKLKCFTVNGVDVTDKLVDNKYTVYDVTEDVIRKDLDAFLEKLKNYKILE